VLEAVKSGCYADGFGEVYADELAEMPVLVGCLVLEFLLRKGDDKLTRVSGGGAVKLGERAALTQRSSGRSAP
jgi:hypothetical protein